MSRLQQGLSRLNSYSRSGAGGPASLNGSMASAAGAAANKSFEDLKRHIHGKLVEKLDFTRVKDLQSDALRKDIRRVIEHLCDTENPLLNRMERERLIDEILDETLGFGPPEARLNVLISGGTGCGKTTLLNTLSSFIPDDERIITIEDAAELQLQQSHVVRLETRPPNIEGKGAVICRDLVRNALRMRPERIIIGECRGAETLDMLQAMNTGHAGSMTTLHANNPRDALSRMETMIMMGGFEMPIKAMRQQMASAVDIIIQANRLQGGPRKVTTVTEVLN